MTSPDRVEYYLGDRLLIALDSSIVPPSNALINIAGTTYSVRRITYAIDYSASVSERRMRANVDLVLP